MNKSVEFFDRQFRGPSTAAALELNPFEKQTLPFLTGDVLDFGCGLGNLAFAAARQGCRVTALDASAAAIDHIRSRAAMEGVTLSAAVADLSDYRIDADYDCVVSIGLLMFLDCPKAFQALSAIQEHVRPGGYAVVNVLVEGTTYLDMFDPEAHCLFAESELRDRFAGWQIAVSETADFEAPRNTVKRFATLIARKPDLRATTGA
jgi:tellurite methyltransferase